MGRVCAAKIPFSTLALTITNYNDDRCFLLSYRCYHEKGKHGVREGGKRRGGFIVLETMPGTLGGLSDANQDSNLEVGINQGF